MWNCLKQPHRQKQKTQAHICHYQAHLMLQLLNIKKKKVYIKNGTAFSFVLEDNCS